jgi:hypothetical protein
MGRSTKTALIADDDEFFRMALRTILTNTLDFRMCWRQKRSTRLPLCYLRKGSIWRCLIWLCRAWPDPAA